VAQAGVLQGLDEHATLLIASDSDADTWRERLRVPARILVLPVPAGEGDAPTRQEVAQVGAACAGAAARLLGVIAREPLAEALDRELADVGAEARAASRAAALAAFDAWADHEGCVRERAGGMPEVRPEWIDLPLDPAALAAPDIEGAATSVAVRTGLWRTMRPELDAERCNRCTWLCGSLCPDGVITADAEGYPEIDLDHCKGCLVCVAVCPRHALRAVPERRAAAEASEPPRSPEASP
jgi:pyruvate ferredoxin oxidoreductase gamma subunit